MSGESSRDALRLACRCDGKGDHHRITDAEFDAIAREQGYIKPEDLDVVPTAQERRRLRTLTDLVSAQSDPIYVWMEIKDAEDYANDRLA